MHFMRKVIQYESLKKSNRLTERSTERRKGRLIGVTVTG